MRILILSCNTGQGHNSAAAAVRDALQEKGHHCDVADSLGFIARWVSAGMSKGHALIYRRIPGLFRWGYGYAERNRDLFRQNSLLYRFLTCGSGRLFRYCREREYDAVVAAHVFSALMLTETLRRYPLNVKSYFISTDYTCSPSAEQSDLDQYFIPDRELTEEFVKCGILPERVVPCGIPVRREFSEKLSGKEAKAALGIPEEHTHLLMMCGSMGCGPMEQLALHLARELPAHSELTVVCGTNRRLYKRLSGRLSGCKNVHVTGYTGDISLLMDSADLYVTKAGGISVTEAAAKALPMVLIDAVSGCEGHNMRYFVGRGGAVSAKEVPELVRLCTGLLEDPRARQVMSAALKSMEAGFAADRICDRILEGTPST